MITQMKKYTFLVFHREYEAFLEQLREAGVVHITEKAAGMADDAHLQELLAKAEQTRTLGILIHTWSNSTDHSCSH